MRTVAIVSRKGGVGKTTTAEALGRGLAAAGKKVLVLDLDSQLNLSYSLIGKTSSEKTVLDVLKEEADISDAVIPAGKNIDAVMAHEKLGNADKMFTDIEDFYILSQALEKVRDSYDYCIIDTPAAYGFTTTSAIQSADTCIIVVEPDAYSAQGVISFAKNIEVVRKRLENPDVTISGILLTKYASRSNLAKAYTEELERCAEMLGTKVFASKIRNCVKLREAQSAKKGIFEYAKGSNASADYGEFVKEFLKGEKKAAAADRAPAEKAAGKAKKGEK